MIDKRIEIYPVVKDSTTLSPPRYSPMCVNAMSPMSPASQHRVVTHHWPGLLRLQGILSPVLPLIDT